MTDTTELAALADLALELATSAGALAVRRRDEGIGVEATKSSQVDVVTAADREIESMIRDRLREARPDDAMLGEEDGGAAGTSGLTWVVDPIDGTVNYLYGQPAWAISIAVCEGEPDPRSWDLVAGVVVAPDLATTWSASRGGGAFRNGVPIRVSTQTDLALSLVATGFGYGSEQRAAQAEALLPVLPRVRDIRRLGSCAVDLCMVADGTLEGYYEAGVHAWDMAAGELMVREAGGVVTGLGGERASLDMVVAGNAGVVGALVPILEAGHSAAASGV